MTNKGIGVVSFAIILSWWLWFLMMVTPLSQPIIPWAVYEPMGIWLEDPYQTKIQIEDSRMEQWQAQQFFLVPQRDPFEQLVYKGETV